MQEMSTWDLAIMATMCVVAMAKEITLHLVL